MTTMGKMRCWTVAMAFGMLLVGQAQGAPLTADDAAKIALRSSTEILNAEAGIVGARGTLLSSYGALLPSVSVDVSRSNTRIDGTFGPVRLPDGSILVGGPSSDSRNNQSATTISVPNIGILNWSSWKNLSAARQNLRATRLQRNATRNDVALATRRQFYGVVQAIKLAEVAGGALKRARDDERRVRAMFEVGSVSKSDLLKAQVATAQSELDSITASHSIVTQRIGLALQMGVDESSLGELDTILVGTPGTYDEVSVLAEAAKNRPDLIAADAALKSARADLAAARIARLPYVTMGGSASFNGRSFSKGREQGQAFVDFPASGNDKRISAQVSLNWDVFDLARVDSRIAGSRSQLMRAQSSYDALRRNLAGEVHQQLLAHAEALEQNKVAQRGLESATENLKLTQEKYNVGSATILELIDAQVQLQTAQSNVVKALAAIRVAEAQINRVRGQAE